MSNGEHPEIRREYSAGTASADAVEHAAEMLAGHDTPSAVYVYRGLELRMHSVNSDVWLVTGAEGGIVEALHSPGFSSASEFLGVLDDLADDHGADNGGEN